VSALRLGTQAPLRPGKRAAAFPLSRCGRSHNALTGTPLARLRKKECWLPYLQCVLDSRTVRDTARVVKVHRTTSFRWRHRFVPGAMRDRPATLSAIVEADETYRLESQKGSRSLTRRPRKRGGVAQRRGINREHDCLLVACDRSGQTLDFHTGRGQVTVAQLHECLKPALPDRRAADQRRRHRLSSFRSRGWHHARSGERASRRTGARRDSYTERQQLAQPLQKLAGTVPRVASRYLINYSGWQRVLGAHRLTTPAHLLCAAVQLG
jgi:hypothetical protein